MTFGYTPRQNSPKLAHDLLEAGKAIQTGHFISDLANFSALIFDTLPDLNWCGFYLWSDSAAKLLVGPFQGRVACVEIEMGKGVCGTAFQKQETLNVPDVHLFPGHIACDERSRSELVIPFSQGVLDLDSPLLARFSAEDQKLLEEFVRQLL